MSDHWQLGIESSVPQASIALLRGGEVVAERQIQAQQNHSAVLIEPLAEVLEALPEGPKLAEVVVATGPGSYNGARVGIAVGQGIALIYGCPTGGIPSLEAIGEVQAGGPCLAIGDARRGTFFTIGLSGGRIQGEPELTDAHEEFVRRVEQAVADGAFVFSLEEIGRLRLPEELAEKVVLATPEARLAVAVWEGCEESAREKLRNLPPQPYYLRPPNITQAKKR